MFLLAVGLSSCGIFEDGVDDRAPSVEILTPFDGAELGGGSVRFRAQAQTLGSETDNFISFVTLSLDGQQIGEAEPVSNADGVSTFVLGWNSFDVPDGEYILEAVAFDRFDARGLSAPVRVVVNNDGLDNTSSLNVEIVSPVDRAEVAGLVRVIAESTNQLGPAVTKMDLLLDGITIDTDASAPFIFEWNAASSFTGFRTLRVRAFVDDDTFVYSEPVFVTVVEAGEDPDPSPGDVAFRGAGIDGQVFGSAGVGFNNDIYVGSDSDTLYSFSQDGALQWKFGTRGPIRSSPVIANNEDIFVTSEDGRLYALNASGRQIWPSYTTNAQFRATPALGI
ncbi:MAG: Ig-like domain-containing protein, partial [Bacteroidota bacterium]